MDTPQLILAVLAVISSLGGASAWFARSRGVSTVSLLKTNIEAYKDAEKLKDARIAYLEGQNTSKDETIKNLNKVIRNGKTD